MYQIRFVRQGVVHETQGGLLSDACAAAGLPLDLVCGGKGRCGKCRVEIVRSGGVRESVLACETQVEEDLSVYLEDRQVSRAAEVMTGGRSHQSAALRPAVTKRCFTRQELTPEHCGAFLSGCRLPLLRRFAALIADHSLEEITLTYYGDEPVAAEAGDTSARLYGGAVDIGTTTVALYLYDLTTGQRIHTGSSLNPQIGCGADVISRILHAQQDEGGLEELRREILGGISALLEEAERGIPDLREGLFHMVLCGNSTMQHLFLGLSPDGLAADPFVSVTADAVRCTGEEAGLPMAPGGVVDFLPLLGGFVGADTSAVLLTLPEDARDCLMIDLGTNGEIAVGGAGSWKVASTACGPALEGGNIACGMRGAPGAIERVRDGCQFEVIGGGAPQGLCGSGIVDAVAELYRVGVLDSSGAMRTAQEYAQEHPGSPLADRLGQTEDGIAAFFFARGEKPVYLSQKDVRQIQLAKSAIYSGCLTLLADAGLSPDRVTTLYLAGAFGNYIDVDNARYIGLLPPVAEIRSVGNGAGQGAQLCLLDRAQLDRCRDLRAHTEHVELAADPRFVEEYIMNMDFPPKDT